MNVKRIAAVAAILATGLGTAVATAPAASAATGSCSSFNACLFYNSSGYGLGAQFTHSDNVYDYAGSYFSSGPYGSSGAGTAVKNRAASVANGDPAYQITIWQRSGTNPFGNHESVSPFAFKDLTLLKNDNAAGTWQYVG
ncbi:peptidase inhibitor family I36 protein [Kitasatospora sp. NPDC057500]|uniref:peptidase inhibitor family I36 protein n=1 Tax=Kitasatospora sp. NPDC057500 TaxID=3346151 RepID=UPI003677DD7C